nr:VP4 [Letea virus]
MPEPHAVLFVSSRVAPILKDIFLPVWEITGNETLNEIWLKNGQYATDVYAFGNLKHLTIRQARGHCFIFISCGERIVLADGPINPDIILSHKQLMAMSGRDFEALIGRKRVHLRKLFGDILRQYAVRRCLELHGSEAETLNMVDGRNHRICGLTKTPPFYHDLVNDYYPYPDDCSTDEKLVSLLDWSVFSANQVIYVGCGDLRTLKLFAKRDFTRFSRVKWVCIDPIVPESEFENVKCVKKLIYNDDALKFYIDESAHERVLIWDVSSDVDKRNLDLWESHRSAEDRLGERIAMKMKQYFAYAVVKHRIPLKDTHYAVTTSVLLPQPGAPENMYELRNLMRLEGKSWQNRGHIPRAERLIVNPRIARKLVETFHGLHRGKKLKKNIYEYLHIEQVNGLEILSDRPRADLFYLTNKQNELNWEKVENVVCQSRISTIWVSKEWCYEYAEVGVARPVVMLKFSSLTHRVLDGNGAVQFLMWKYPHWYNKRLSYDPSWAMKFAVIMEEEIPHPPVPDLSLCRFIGLRSDSSMLRINTRVVHEETDLLKRLDLDVSGHLYVTLVGGSYVTDLYWWFRMILQWSSLNRENKLRQIQNSKAEVIEWKEEKADEPWHRKTDLVAALIAFNARNRILKLDAEVSRWLTELQRCG